MIGLEGGVSEDRMTRRGGLKKTEGLEAARFVARLLGDIHVLARGPVY